MIDFLLIMYLGSFLLYAEIAYVTNVPVSPLPKNVNCIEISNYYD